MGTCRMTEDKRTTERNDMHVEENLIDPGPIPEIDMPRAMQKEMRKALKEQPNIRKK
jgi:hypothetical protein